MNIDNIKYSFEELVPLVEKVVPMSGVRTAFDLKELNFSHKDRYRFLDLMNEHSEDGLCYGYSRVWLSKILENKSKSFAFTKKTLPEAALVIGRSQIHFIRPCAKIVFLEKFIEVKKGIKKIAKRAGVDFDAMSKKAHSCVISDTDNFEVNPRRIRFMCDELQKVCNTLNNRVVAEKTEKKLKKITKFANTIQIPVNDRAWKKFNKKIDAIWDTFKNLAEEVNCSFDLLNLQSNTIKSKKNHFELQKEYFVSLANSVKSECMQNLENKENRKSVKKIDSILSKLENNAFPSREKWDAFKKGIKAVEKSLFLGANRGESFKSKHGKDIIERIRVFSKCNQKVVFDISQKNEGSGHAFLIEKDMNRFTVYDINHKPKKNDSIKELERILVGRNATLDEKIFKTKITPYFPKI